MDLGEPARNQTGYACGKRVEILGRQHKFAFIFHKDIAIRTLLSSFCSVGAVRSGLVRGWLIRTPKFVNAPRTCADKETSRFDNDGRDLKCRPVWRCEVIGIYRVAILIEVNEFGTDRGPKLLCLLINSYRSELLVRQFNWASSVEVDPQTANEAHVRCTESTATGKVGSRRSRTGCRSFGTSRSVATRGARCAMRKRKSGPSCSEEWMTESSWAWTIAPEEEAREPSNARAAAKLRGPHHVIQRSRHDIRRVTCRRNRRLVLQSAGRSIRGSGVGIV